MKDQGRRIVIDLGYEAVLSEVSRAIRDENLQMIARIDVRDYFWRDLGRDFRHYFLIVAWSPELALEALHHDLGVGTLLPTTLAVYELADVQTAIVVREPLSLLAADPGWRRKNTVLASIADRHAERMARVLARLQHPSPHQASTSPAV